MTQPTHLETFSDHFDKRGFSCTPHGDLFIIGQPDRVPFFLGERDGGIVLFTAIDLTPYAYQNIFDLLQWVELLNRKSRLVRYYLRTEEGKGALTVSCWLPTNYDPITFSRAVTLWQQDVDGQLTDPTNSFVNDFLERNEAP